MAAADSCDGISTSGGGWEKTVTLVSSDDARFEVREAAASLSQTVRRMIRAGGDGGIPLPKVDARTLSTVLEYCNKHAAVPAPAPESSSAEAAAVDLEWFDKELMHVDLATLCSLIRAADYLEVAGLLDLTCKTVADMIKSKTAEEIRQMFGIQNDFTPEEEEQLSRENAGVFE
ncbi:hypothetical protein SETIT_4G187100v2 [Setaria italica]|uniref:SKP1-like protein n=1 Tax=Setaria italica TaxID=4555 RepID=K3XZL6_SETIT|nr:SKP1-like protein 1A [Setaria italica]RCV22028.1 hypothetical protein SETIT_4G187100v2 [Setaria italica]